VPYSDRIPRSSSQTGWIEGAAIIGAVFTVVFVSSLNDFSKEKQFRKLNAVKEDSKVNVMRDGAVKQISKYDIVVGEVVLLAQVSELPYVLERECEIIWFGVFSLLVRGLERKHIVSMQA
jgi:magnesium-transporting ATPase (P-type)